MVNLGMVYYCFTSITTNGCLCLGLKQVPSDTKRAVPGIPSCLGFRISRKGASLVVLMTTAGFRSTRNSERVLFRLWRWSLTSCEWKSWSTFEAHAVFVHPTSRAMANTEARMAAESICEPMAVHDIPWPLEGTIRKTQKLQQMPLFFWIKWWIHQEIQKIIDSANSRSHQPSTINHQPTNQPSTIKPPTFQMISPYP